MKKIKRHVLEDPELEIDDVEEEEGECEDEDDSEEDDDDDDDDDFEDDFDVDDEDEDEEDDDEEEDEEDEAEWSPPSRRPAFRWSRSFGYDDEEEELTERMAAAIRAGKYVPRRSDPWTAHILYNALKDTGRL